MQQSFQDDEPFSLTYRIQTTDDDQKWVWETGTGVIEEGETVTLVGHIVDITEQKEELWSSQKP